MCQIFTQPIFYVKSLCPNKPTRTDLRFKSPNQTMRKEESTQGRDFRSAIRTTNLRLPIALPLASHSLGMRDTSAPGSNSQECNTSRTRSRIPSASIARLRCVQGTCECSRWLLEAPGEEIRPSRAYSAPVIYGSLAGGSLCWVVIVVYMRLGPNQSKSWKRLDSVEFWCW